MSSTACESDKGQLLPVLPPQLLTRLRWRVLPLLWLGYAICIIDRTNIAYAKLQMGADLHLSEQDFGFSAGIFFLSYALAQLPSNFVLARVGSAYVLAAILVVWGSVSAATGLVQGKLSLYLLRFLLGLSEAYASPTKPRDLLFVSVAIAVPTAPCSHPWAAIANPRSVLHLV